MKNLLLLAMCCCSLYAASPAGASQQRLSFTASAQQGASVTVQSSALDLVLVPVGGFGGWGCFLMPPEREGKHTTAIVFCITLQSTYIHAIACENGADDREEGRWLMVGGLNEKNIMEPDVWLTLSCKSSSPAE